MRRFLVSFIIVLLSVNYSYSIFRDSVLVLVNRRGYQVDVVYPGRYVIVKNFAGKKAEGKLRILNKRTIIVGHTLVPIRNISKLIIKSKMYPVSVKIVKAGNFFISTIPKKMFSSLSFSAQGPAALLLFLIFILIALVSVIFGLLVMFVALPGLIVGKTYNMRQWKLYIKPRKT